MGKLHGVAEMMRAQGIDRWRLGVLELLGGREPGLDFAVPAEVAIDITRVGRAPRPHAPSPEELVAHQAMLAIITQPLWLAEA